MHAAVEPQGNDDRMKRSARSQLSAGFSRFKPRECSANQRLHSERSMRLVVADENDTPRLGKGGHRNRIGQSSVSYIPTVIGCT